MTDDTNGRSGGPGAFDPAQAVRSAVAAAAVGAAVGALRAFTTRRTETDAPPEEDGRTVESDEELTDEQEEPDPRDDDEPEHDEPEEDELGDEEPDEEPQASARPEPEPEREPEPEPKPRSPRQRPEEPKPEPAPPGQLFELAERARDAVRQLRGAEAEAVSGFVRTANGWVVTLEVVELHRIPESTDLLATYEVELAEDGGLVRFERTRRYHRGQGSDEG